MVIKSDWDKILLQKLNAIEGMLKALKQNLKFKKDKIIIQQIIKDIIEDEKKIKNMGIRGRKKSIIKY